MSDLIEFLRARYTEEEARAVAATAGPWRADLDEEQVLAPDEGGALRGPLVVAQMRDFNRAMTGAQVEADTTLIAVHADPVRVLREVEAKRRLVGGIESHLQRVDDFSAQEHDFFMLMTLARPYSDHPDYREEWRP